jgi:NADP-dependent 3-hydroxy acid dehydrogenase YdfG
MACRVGYGNVAEGDARYSPTLVTGASSGVGSGRGRENNRDDWSSRAVGERIDFDMIAAKLSRR